MKKLLIATHNPGKIVELKTFLSELPVKLISLSDLDITQEFEELGKTYKENSEGKALFYSKLANLPSIADDGGIEIVALNGEPGVRSSRWLGPQSTDQDIFNHMIKIAHELPDNNRTAYFKTTVSFALPNSDVWSERGEIKGTIAEKPFVKTSKGYPYRSFFYLPGLKKYYHEKDLTEKETKLYNHRYKAVLRLLPTIKKNLI